MTADPLRQDCERRAEKAFQSCRHVNWNGASTEMCSRCCADALEEAIRPLVAALAEVYMQDIGELEVRNTDHVADALAPHCSAPTCICGNDDYGPNESIGHTEECKRRATAQAEPEGGTNESIR